MKRDKETIRAGQRRRVLTSANVYWLDAGDAATLMDHADKAIYTVKQAGKYAYCLYSGGKLLVPEPGSNAGSDSLLGARPQPDG